jgi:hypothetical protein
VCVRETERERERERERDREREAERETGQRYGSFSTSSAHARESTPRKSIFGSPFLFDWPPNTLLCYPRLASCTSP